MPKLVYCYDDNGWLTGSSAAVRSPKDKDEVYLIPANATDIVPPTIADGKIPRFVSGAWVLEHDHTALEKQKLIEESIALAKREAEERAARDAADAAHATAMLNDLRRRFSERDAKSAQLRASIHRATTVSELKGVLIELVDNLELKPGQ